MADLNSVNLVGRLTRDAEMRTSGGGTAILKFSIAQNRRRKQGDNWVDESHFFDAVMMGRGAEAISRYMVKGKQVAISGELRQNRWEQDGQPRSKVEIFAQNVQLLGGGDGNRPGSGGQYGGDANSNQNYGAPPAFDNSFNEDIPF